MPSYMKRNKERWVFFLLPTNFPDGIFQQFKLAEHFFLLWTTHAKSHLQLSDRPLWRHTKLTRMQNLFWSIYGSDFHWRISFKLWLHHFYLWLFRKTRRQPTLQRKERKPYRKRGKNMITDSTHLRWSLSIGLVTFFLSNTAVLSGASNKLAVSGSGLGDGDIDCKR